MIINTRSLSGRVCPVVLKVIKSEFVSSPETLKSFANAMTMVGDGTGKFAPASQPSLVEDCRYWASTAQLPSLLMKVHSQ